MEDLRSDPVVVRKVYATPAVEQAIMSGVTEHGDDFVISVESTEPGEGVGDYIANGPAQAAPSAVQAAPGSTGIAGAPKQPKPSQA
ncbi:MAG TPA: hypothetical protein VGE77_02045 [Nocardioides sp.]